MQCLADLGYQESVAVLERESGMRGEADLIKQFKDAVLQGEWERVAASVDQLQLQGAQSQQFQFMLWRQVYLEHLEQRNLKDALQVLRQ